jgi:hypothetical protein
VHRLAIEDAAVAGQDVDRFKVVDAVVVMDEIAVDLLADPRAPSRG